MKVLAIDYGSKRVGLALGDTETNLALPFGIIEPTNNNDLFGKLKQLIEAEEIELIVVGEPVTFSGKSSEQTKTCKNFAQLLRNTVLIPVELMDERLTSSRADAAVLGSQAPTRGRDELAAMFLLQDYLDRSQST